LTRHIINEHNKMNRLLEKISFSVEIMSLSKFQRTSGIPAAVHENRPIPFVPKVKKGDKKRGKTDKTLTIKIE
jgi:hypothetical protein